MYYNGNMTTVPRLYENFVPTNYDLTIDLTDKNNRLFSGKVIISGTSLIEKNIKLHAKELCIESVAVDGRIAEFSSGDFDELTIKQGGLLAGSHVVEINFSGKITDSMHGLYPCYFKDGDIKKELLATQFESHHAREVFPCVDEPEAKATFDLTLKTEPAITVLGNTEIASQSTKGSHMMTRFATTPKMSTYLLAWVCGELQSKSGVTKNGVKVNIYCTKAQKATSLDFALDHAIKTIDFFDDYFGVKYPLTKSDHVALPDFSSGAMENWGLITYRESALLADPKDTSLSSKQYIATVISHELSHQWFGNLVTMKWWNDLWLNESFANMMEYVAVDAIHPEWNVWLDFASQESVLALRRDALEGVQSVQTPVNHPDEISSIFDPAIVYAKGSRLMKMCQDYIGESAFRAGLTSYFKDFAYKNTEASDLWKHLSRASKKDVSGFMDYWISNSGYPVVIIDKDGLSQQQFFIGKHQPSDKVWPIPLISNNSKLPKLFNQQKIDARIDNQTRLNIGNSAHFITKYPDHALSEILSTDLDEISRMQLLHEQTLLIRAGMKPSAAIIDLLTFYKNETSHHVWSIMSLAFGELKKFVETDKPSEKKLRKLAGDLSASLYNKLGWSEKTNEPENDTKLRPIIIGLTLYSENTEALATAKQLFDSGIESFNPEIRSLIISSAVRHSTDDNLVPDLLYKYQQISLSSLKEDICSGLTSATRQQDINFLLSKMTDKNIIRPQDNFRWFAYMMFNSHSREAAWQWMRDNWDWIEDTFGSDKSYDYYPRYAANGLATSKQRAEYQHFFSSKRQDPALTRVIDLGLNEIDAKITLLKNDSQAVRDKLSQL